MAQKTLKARKDQYNMVLFLGPHSVPLSIADVDGIDAGPV
jgi:hypothetical protein